MSLIVVGLNHRTVPVDLLERMTVSASALPKALHDLSSRDHLLESVLLSTCNRTEVYAHATKFHGAVGDVCEFLATLSGADPDEFTDHLYTYYESSAVNHLFGVAAGLDSMIVGEHEILGQVRDAWQLAEREQAAGQHVSRAFRHAIEAGRRVRTETELGRHPVSISSAAVAVAGERIGGYDGCRALVVGVGEIGRGVARSLRHRQLGDICIVNRTRTRAEDVAGEVGARVGEFDDFGRELVEADVVFTSTAADDVVLERAGVEHVMRTRQGTPLLFVDLALPRDVDAGVAELEGVELLDLDDLKDFAARSAERRRREITRAREILDLEVERYETEIRARELAPLIAALRARADEIREVELDRHAPKLAELTDDQRDAVELLTRGLVNKLLHEPTVRLKRVAGTDLGDIYADALARLFDLPPEE